MHRTIYLFGGIQVISIDFFLHILHEKYILKQKVVVIETPKSWKFKANIARNIPFEGN